MGFIASAASNLIGGLLGKSSKENEAEARFAAGREGAEQVQPFVDTGAGANTAVSDALGQGAPGAQATQFQNFLASTGTQEQLKLGQEAITSSRASRGLLNSGGTLKRLTEFGQGLAKRGFSNFLGNLNRVADRGLGAAQSAATSISQAGQAAAGAASQGADRLQSGLGSAAGSLIRGFSRR